MKRPPPTPPTRLHPPHGATLAELDDYWEWKTGVRPMRVQGARPFMGWLYEIGRAVKRWLRQSQPKETKE